MNRENETERFKRLCREAAQKGGSDVMTPERLRRIASYREVDEELLEFARLSAERLSDESEREEVAVNRGILSKLSRKRTMLIMTWLVLLLFGVGVTITLFMGDTVIAGKDNTKKTEQIDKTTVIHGGIVESTPEPVAQVEQETDWSKISRMKDFLPQLYIPSYVPEGYAFNMLYIEKFDKQYRVEYQFLNGPGESLCITQLAFTVRDRDTTFFDRFDREITSDGETIYLNLVEDQKTVVATTIRGDDQINIVSSLGDVELKKIFEGLGQ